MKRLSSLFAGALLVAAAHAAQADPAFFCAGAQIETGMGTTKEEVLDKCGPPTVKDMDRWYYKNQPGQITVVLTFETGKLNQIQHVQE